MAHDIRTWAKQGTYRRRGSYLGGVVQRRQKRVKTSRLKLAKPVRALVDRRINRNLETKMVAYHFRRTQIDNLPDIAARCWRLVPGVEQGDTRATRTGSKIRLQNLSINGYVQIPSYDASTSNDRSSIMLRLLCVTPKGYRFTPDVIATWAGPGNLYTQLFKTEAIATAPQGYWIDQYTEVNRDMFTVHADKRMVFSRGDMFNVPGAEGAAWRPDLTKRFSFRVKCKNKIGHFAQVDEPGYAGDPTEMQNFAPVLVAMWSFTNGAAPSAAACPFVEYLTKMTFKDIA